MGLTAISNNLSYATNPDTMASKPQVMNKNDYSRKHQLQTWQPWGMASLQEQQQRLQQQHQQQQQRPSQAQNSMGTGNSSQHTVLDLQTTSSISELMKTMLQPNLFQRIMPKEGRLHYMPSLNAGIQSQLERRGALPHSRISSLFQVASARHAWFGQTFCSLLPFLAVASVVLCCCSVFCSASSFGNIPAHAMPHDKVTGHDESDKPCMSFGTSAGLLPGPATRLHAQVIMSESRLIAQPDLSIPYASLLSLPMQAPPNSKACLSTPSQLAGPSSTMVMQGPAFRSLQVPS